MKRTCLFYLILVLIGCLLSACQTADTTVVAPPPGLKITDLQDTTLTIEKADFLISFRVFQYQLDPNSISRLASVFDTVTAAEIRFHDEQAFRANGFAVGSGTRQDASGLARALADAGAARIGFTLLSIPPAETSILSSTSIYQPLSISFYKSAEDASAEYLYPGYLGWTLIAESSAVRDTAIIKIAPAYWQSGAEDIRILSGREPIAFQPFQFAAFQTRMREGDFLLLAPSRLVPDPQSLSQGLFLQAGRKPKVTCYVIFCESAGL